MSIIAFWFILQAVAQTPTDIPAKIEKANKALRQLTGPTTCENCGFVAGEEDELPAWKQCLQIVCGHKLNADNEMTSRILATPFYKSETYAEFNPLVEAAFRSQVEAELAAARAADKYLSEKIEDVTADRIAKIVQTLDVVGQLEYNSEGELDEVKSYDKLVAGRSSSEAHMAIAVGKKIAEINNNQDPLFADDFEYVRQSMSDGEIRKSITRLTGELAQMTKELESATGIPEDILGSPSARQRREARFQKGQFTSRDIESLKTDVQGTRLFRAMVKDPKLAETADRWSGTYRDRADAPNLKERIKILEDFLRPAAKDAVSPLHFLKTQQHFNCYTAVAMAANTSPSDSTIKKYVQFDEPALRSKYMEKLSRHLSASSSKNLSQEMRKWKMRTPESARAFREGLKDSLEALAADNANLIKSVEKPREAPLRARFAGLYAALRSSVDLNEILAQDINDVCVENIPDRFADKAYFFDGKFELSGRAMEEGRSSDSTVMHEYSHLVSGFIQKGAEISRPTQKWFADSRSCLAQGHNESGEKRIEEDFADMLAGSFAGGGKSYCEVIPDGDEFFTLKNWNSSDPTHSGHLYRVLHYRVLSGEGIPAICKTALAEKGESPFERNCLKETPEASSAAAR